MDFFRDLFDTDFMPHGHCYFWKPAVLWSNVLGDALIALAYFIIPFLLVRFLNRRKDIRFRPIFGAFAAFILACGTTHLLEIISVWEPMYRLTGLVKAVTAVVSLGTVGLMFYLFPVVLKIPTAEQWKTMRENLQIQTQQREKSEEGLMRSERRFRTTLKNAPAGIGIANWDGYFLEVNEAMVKLFGYAEKELSNMTFRQITHPDDLGTSEKVVQELKNGQRDSVQMEKRYVRADGSTFWGLLHVSPVRTENYFIIHILDISERKQAEELVRDANRLLEEKVIARTSELQESKTDLEDFLYAVTHDLRVPLHNLNGLTALVEEEFEGELKNEEARQTIRMIGENARRMDELVTDLLAFSRAARTELVKKPLDMSSLAQEAFDELRPLFATQSIDFQLEPLPMAQGDATTIKQVWQNLLSNALKYSSKKEVIHVRVSGRQEDGKVIYQVADQGAGFDERYRNKLFNLFQRLHSPDEFEGTGVGLATCYRIVKKHGGEIWGEGKIDAGATFYFSLPLVNSQSLQGE